MRSWVAGGTPHSADGNGAEDAPPVAGGGTAEWSGAGQELAAEIYYGPFNVWGTPVAAFAQWRPGLVSFAAAAGAAVLLLVAAWIAGGSHRGAAGGVQDADPDAVARAFVARYAVHDPAACELVTSPLRARLDGEGRCRGPIRGTAPQLAVMASLTCGAVHHVDAVVAPEGEFGKRFVAVSLERAGGTAWLVRSVLAIDDCRVLVPPVCDGRR